MSTRKNCLVKLSGDVLTNEVLEWIRDLSLSYFVVVCVGGGTQINKAFKEAGYPVGKHGPLGRETNTFAERRLARSVLEDNQTSVQDNLARLGAHSVTVVIPVLEIGGVLCHINGDEFLKLCYHGFNMLYAVTTEDRVDEKIKLFEELSKIKVVEEHSLPCALAPVS